MSSISDFQNLLQAQFDGPLAAIGQRYGGVKVVLATIENTPQKRIGKPRLILSLESDVVSRFNGASGAFRDCVFKFVAECNESSGAATGVANPSPVQVDIAAAVQKYLQDNALEIHNAGYQMPEVRMERSQTTKQVSTSTGRFLFTYKRE